MAGAILEKASRARGSMVKEIMDIMATMVSPDGRKMVVNGRTKSSSRATNMANRKCWDSKCLRSCARLLTPALPPVL